MKNILFEAGKLKQTGYGNKVYSDTGFAASVGF